MLSALLALALILGVTAATSLYLERKRLFTLADGAALAASESFDLASVVAGGAPGAGGAGNGSGQVPNLRPTLTTAGVTGAAQQYLASVDNAGLEGLVLQRSVTTDGRSATIALASSWRPPVVSLFLPEGIRLEVEATARSIFF
jgi:hypothetical protein